MSRSVIASKQELVSVWNRAASKSYLAEQKVCCGAPVCYVCLANLKTNGGSVVKELLDRLRMRDCKGRAFRNLCRVDIVFVSTFLSKVICLVHTRKLLQADDQQRLAALIRRTCHKAASLFAVPRHAEMCLL